MKSLHGNSGLKPSQIARFTKEFGCTCSEEIEGAGRDQDCTVCPVCRKLVDFGHPNWLQAEIDKREDRIEAKLRRAGLPTTQREIEALVKTDPARKGSRVDNPLY